MTRRTVFTLALLILTGCSGGTEQPPLELEIIEAGQEVIVQSRAAPPAERPPLRRADLDVLDGSFMEITRERADLLAYLYVNAQRTDRFPGRIIVWRSDDDVTLATRNGVLIETRGMRGDLLSSTVRVAGNRPGPASSGAHVQMIHSLDNRQVQLALDCDLVDLGPKVIEIVEHRHNTRHLQQRCQGGGGVVVNDFWVDESAGLVWQSRQWAGPHIGYLRLRRLTR